MGMPSLLYRWWYGAHSVRSLERNILRFTGVHPVRRTLLGGVDTAGEARIAGWLAAVRQCGRRAE